MDLQREAEMEARLTFSIGTIDSTDAALGPPEAAATAAEEEEEEEGEREEGYASHSSPRM